MDRGVFVGGLLISVSFLAAVMLNHAATQREVREPATLSEAPSVSAPQTVNNACCTAREPACVSSDSAHASAAVDCPRTEPGILRSDPR
jgi:hypothetical protein